MADHRERITIAAIILFMAVWATTEYVSWLHDRAFAGRVTEFMNRGDRFTGEDGRRLEDQLHELDAKIEQMRSGHEKISQ